MAATSPADIPVISTPRRSPSLDVVDAQIHVRGEPGLAMAAMDAVGVEAAVVDIYPPDTHVGDDGITRYDWRLAQTAIERFPGRFAYMGRVDPADPDLDAIMKRFAETPDLVCVRTSDRAALEAGRDAPMLAAAGRFGIPVMIVVAGKHEAMMRYLAGFDEVQFILDHVAMDARRTARPSISASVDALLAYGVPKRGGQMDASAPPVPGALSISRRRRAASPDRRGVRRGPGHVGQRLHGDPPPSHLRRSAVLRALLRPPLLSRQGSGTWSDTASDPAMAPEVRRGGLMTGPRVEPTSGSEAPRSFVQGLDPVFPPSTHPQPIRHSGCRGRAVRVHKRGWWGLRSACLDLV